MNEIKRNITVITPTGILRAEVGEQLMRLQAWCLAGVVTVTIGVWPADC